MTRLEDEPLLRGSAKFTADLAAPDALHAVFVRSDIAHGRLRAVDVADAVGADGVAAVWTAAELDLPPYPPIGADLPTDYAPGLLATDTVRQVGDPFAVVLAETVAQATDAAELVEAEIEPLVAIIDPRESEQAPPLYGDAPNRIFELNGDDADVDVLGGAVTTIALEVENPKLASAPLECDGIIATPDGGRLDVWCTSQGVHSMADQIAIGLGIDRAKLRVRSSAVGGGFGGRGLPFAEFIVVCRAALVLGRPVRWSGNRAENLLRMPQGRGYVSTVRLGLDGEGAPVGLDVDVLADAGVTAHLSALLLTNVNRQAVGLYRIPALRFRSRAVLTNTTPVGAYRGAGQPEANHFRERLIDIAARRLGIDPIDYRFRHLLNPQELPTDQPGGVDYDVGDAPGALRRCVELLEVDRLRSEQADRRSSGSKIEIGIGVACYAQTSARGTPKDVARLRIDPDGRVTIFSGSPSHGQGHRTTLAGIVADRLGIDPEDIDLVDSDTAVIDGGLTTGGSRGSQVLGSIVANGCDQILDEARSLAASMLEVADVDIVVEPAGYGRNAGLAVAGVPTKRIEWGELAADQDGSCLEAARAESLDGACHPYGAHGTVVEVDTETGDVRVVTHAAVDDCGTVLQPILVEGQQHGGAVAGIAQALWEEISYTPDGQPQTTSFLDYLLPAASEIGDLLTDTITVATERNPLGTKGIGENGCNGATGAVHNAVMDALTPYGVEHIDMPLTPEKIWRAIDEGATVADEWSDG